nr:uncharacterized protein LOC123767957 isoform X2 [Procambarus clarkii]
MRRQDQAAALQQQLMSQGKLSPTPIRKDVTAATVSGLQQLQNLQQQQQQQQQQHMANKFVGRVATSLPTAALLQQSTIATSDTKPRMLIMPGQPISTSESPLSSLQRARLRSSTDQLASPEEYSLAGVNATLAMLTGTPSTPAGTPRGLRDDSSDTMSETDSQKSLRIRRKLPLLPPDQEAAPLPSHKKNAFGYNAKDRVRSQMSRQSSLDGSSSCRMGGPLSMTRPSSSMTNLANISKMPDITLPARPGSALGIPGHPSVGLRSSSLSGPQLKTGLPATIVQCLPPDLHHLIYTNTQPPALGDTYGSQLPEYMQSLKDQLQEELKSSSNDRRAMLEAELLRLHEDRRRALTEKDKERDGRLRRELDRLASSSYSGSLSLKQRMEIQRRLGMTSGTSNTTGSANSSPRNHRRRGHRRQMSDPKIFSSVSPIKEDRDMEKELERSLYGVALRDTAINCMDDDDLLAARLLGMGRTMGRRSSESGLGSDFWGRSSTPGGTLTDSALFGSSRQKTIRKSRKPRSWHPSPYASDDEDDLLSREEKKQKIKAEISRRRQQIEENSRLHEELLRLARLRESAELGYSDPRVYGPYDQSPPQSARDSTTSVLRSIDEILRDARDPSSGYYSGYSSYKAGGSPPNRYGSSPGARTSPRHYYGSRGPSPSHYPMTEEDRSMARLASTFQSDEFTGALYERLSDFSPLTADSLSDTMSDFTPAMPLLPDMPTRSRKLLEDLGSSPITSQAHRGKYDIQRRYRK